MIEPLCSRLPVLLVDDEPGILRGVRMALVGAGIAEVLTEEDSRNVMPRLEKEKVGVVVLDLTMPHLSGSEVLARIRARFPHIPVIILTADLELSTAVACMKQGAYDYHVKPIDPGKLVDSIKRAREACDLQRELSHLRHGILADELGNEAAFARIITANEKMRSIFRYVEVSAGTGKPILICGESGTGKDLLAEAVHESSALRGGFVKVNVAGLGGEAFSSLLFGGEGGSGKGSSVRGRIDEAEGGTLFIDEIGDLDDASQARILRLLEDGSYLVPGSSLVKRSDARILMSTNRDLRKAAEEGTFRRDLYYRLQMRMVELPPLRERLDDVPFLLNAFVAQAALRLGKEKPPYPPELITVLMQYDFPGNVRELQGMVEEAMVWHRSGILDVGYFREKTGVSAPDLERGSAQESSEYPGAATPNGADLLEKIFGHFPSLDEAEDYLIEEALKITGGNQKAAASLLSITRQTIHRRRKKRREGVPDD